MPTLIPILARPGEVPLRLRIASCAVSGGFMHLYAALGNGLFNKYGVSFEPIHIKASAPSLAALAADEIQFLYCAADATLPTLAAGIGGKLVAVPLVKLPYVLISRKEIRRPEDLRGKSIGTARAGNISERLSKAMTKKFNIPENEVAAFAEAVRFVEKNPAKGKVAVAKVMRTNEAEALQSSYDVYAKKIVDRRVVIPEKAVADTIEQIRLAGGVVRRKSDDLFDNSYTVHL